MCFPLAKHGSKLSVCDVLPSISLCRQAELITKEDNFKTIVMFGEMSVIPLDQLTNMVDKVRKAA